MSWQISRRDGRIELEADIRINKHPIYIKTDSGDIIRLQFIKPFERLRLVIEQVDKEPS